jgi:hypothetical protein
MVSQKAELSLERPAGSTVAYKLFFKTDIKAIVHEMSGILEVFQRHKL